MEDYSDFCPDLQWDWFIVQHDIFVFISDFDSQRGAYWESLGMVSSMEFLAFVRADVYDAHPYPLILWVIVRNELVLFIPFVTTVIDNL